MCLASQNNHPTSLASSWDISFLKSLVQQDPKGSNKVAHHFILDVYDSPNRKYVNLSIIYYIADFSFFMSQDDAYFHIHQNDPAAGDSEHNDVHQRQQILIKDNNDTDQTKRDQILSLVPLLRPLLATALGLRRPPV